MTRPVIAATVLLAVGFCLRPGVLVGQCTPGQSVSPDQINGLRLAIEDEIYASGRYRAYGDLLGGVHGDTLRAYVDPCIRDNLIWVVYKYMPTGEILRAARSSGEGGWILFVSDSTNFGPTNGAAIPTVYLQDDEVIRMKTAWRRLSVVIHERPDQAILNGARTREVVRDSLRMPDRP